MFGTVIGTQLADLAQEVPRYASSVDLRFVPEGRILTWDNASTAGRRS